MGQEKMTYAEVGVVYKDMDTFKRAAQLAGRKTAGNLKRFGFSEFEASRGESAYLIETPDSFWAHVEEGLGTKNLVADAMYRLDQQRSWYDNIAQDTAAAIVNDLITVGALPVSIAMHLAVGDSRWFDNELRCRELTEGWVSACQTARCVWAGGETPTLKDIIQPGTVVLSGSATGIVRPKERLLIGTKIQHGDSIVLVSSSGIHANGLTLARTIAGKLPEGYLTKLNDGRCYGGALLDPTIIYVPLIEDCLNAGVELHYAVNITGHGWRKLMRANEAFAYVIDRIPEPQPVFAFIQEHGPVDDAEAYGNLNMGAGFALYVSEEGVPSLIATAQSLGMTVLHAGYIERSETKRVIIRPKGLEFSADSLAVR